MWARRKSNGLVASSEVDIEPSNQRVDKIISPTFQSERDVEGQVYCRNGIEVDSKDGGWFRNASFHLNRVNERFGQRGVFQRRVVETIDVIPD